ncbi:zinc-binding dehydrogenase [Kribbella sindirgiensis]|uniref:Alcohol dehydrogenase-like C-terminal domain-containing protein n=1 Tax=Kribbella sindirgiensis TaxID=1124744 RepID=A0A4R0I7T8_9ACTN|nr:zinc-binding dehydrogenase [Kribbella sindirgiensis]TCC21662.1 hypothetical protein E0H50_35905 [Kribbella sindirgiensis]
MTSQPPSASRPRRARLKCFGQILDATGTPAGTAAALNLATEGGIVVILGLCGKPTVPIDVDSLVLRDLALIGSPGVWPEVITLVATGQILPSTLVSHRYSIAQAAQAFALADAAAETTHRIVLHPSDFATEITSYDC